MSKSHRLFIGNIPKGTSEDELSVEFGAYGLVESIEIKTKPNPLNDSVDTFGFVTLQADDKTVLACIKEFREQKYKGVYLNVSKAKESFLDRLKREREEAEAQKRNAASLDPYTKPVEVGSVAESVKPAPTLPTLPTLKKQDESSSSESSESESDEETEADHTGKAEPDESLTRRPQVSKPQDDIVRKWNQETYIEHGKLKIIPITGVVKEVIDRSKSRQGRSEGKKLGEQARIADEKRKQGLTKIKSAYDQQQNAIKSALSGESMSNKRRIAFSDDEDDSTSKPKMSLFDGQEDEDGFEGNFAVRNQLAGLEGQKLYEMQTTYQADNRFRLDSRFLDHGDKSKAAPKSHDKRNEKERRKQLEILSNVTGKTIDGERRDDSKKTPKMQRFDPSQKEYNEKNKEPEMRVEMSDIKKAERREEDFKVSEQKFYSVSEKLISSIKENNKGFSLLSMLGRPAEDRENEEVVNEEVAKQVEDEPEEEKPLKSDAKFKYDSSDSEEEPEPEPEIADHADGDHVDDKSGKNSFEREQDTSWMENVNKRKSGYYSNQGIWKEPFFFLPDDTRFDDGRKFFGITTVPNGVSAVEEADKYDADKKKNDMNDIRKIFKKRRQREGKNVRIKSKLGFKMMKKKTLRK